MPVVFSVMAEVVTTDRRATKSEIEATRDRLRQLAHACGLDNARLRDDGAIVIHSQNPGYLRIGRYATEAAAIVGSYVHVVTDDVAGSESSSEPL